ncbi:MAG: type I restriction-modification system subunit M N-terminal domain-containing protein [Thermaurantiacus sp.]
MSVRTTVKAIEDIMRKDVGIDGDAQRLSQMAWMFFLKIIDDQDQELELLRDDYSSPIPPDLQWRAWAADPEGLTGEALLAFVNDRLFPRLKALPTVASARHRLVQGVLEDAYNDMKSGQLMRQVLNLISTIDFNNLADRQYFGDIYEQMLADLQPAGNAGKLRRRAPSPPSWCSRSIRSPARSGSTQPAARAAFSPAPSATCAPDM